MQGIPLSLLVPWPENQLGPIPSADLLDHILVADLITYKQGGNYYISGKAIYYQEKGILLGIPGIDDFGIVLRELAKIEISFGLEGFSFRLQLGMFSIRLPQGTFTKVQVEDGRPKLDERGEWILEDEPVELDVAWTSDADGVREHLIVFEIDHEGKFKFQSFIDGETHPLPSISMPFSLINSTGVAIFAEHLQVNLGINDPSFTADLVNIDLPDRLFGNSVPPDLQFKDVRIDKHGFTGVVSTLWPLEYERNKGFFFDIVNKPTASLFGLKGGIRNFKLDIRQNTIIVSDISGGLVIPYFDEPVDVRVNIQGDGSFSITLLGLKDDITLTKEELLSLNIQSLTVAKLENTASVEVYGGLQPLLMAAGGLEWPRLNIKDLSIEQDIADLTRPPILKFKEAWLDLKELAPLDLWGFHFELNRVGLGFEGARDRLWVDLAGSLRLIEQIPVGLDVEGFRLSWPRDLSAVFGSYQGLELATRIASQLEVEFDGAYLFFGAPGAIEFEGFLEFIKSAQVVGFRGDMALRVPSTGLAIEAGLMVGINFETPPYPFLLLTFGIELPAGIPLAQSGLALKGAQGLFGLNVSPNRTADQNWYYDWYKRDPVGAHKTSKWNPERNALALGIGLTITTVDGYVKGVRGLLVLAIPGPILIIEGRALIFNGLTPAEPPMRALAVIDGKEQIIQFNIEAEAELIEDMLDAYGMLEAFFDFQDLTNWHMYLGQDEPRDRRIQANVLKFNDAFLFKADAYLMVDMIGSQTLRSRMGIYLGFKPPIPDFGPVEITLDAVLEGRGEVTVLPEQFSGEVDLSANIELKAFGFGLQLTAAAGVLPEGPKPLKVDAELIVSAELPWPLEDFEETLQFSWEAQDPPEISPPLVAVTADSPFAPGGGALQIRERGAVENQSVWRLAAENSPVAPIDTLPVLSFSHETNDEARLPGTNYPKPAFARHPSGDPKTYDVGLMRFTPTLTTVRLYEHRKGEAWPSSLNGWKRVASSRTVEINENVALLPGVWMAEANPQDPGNPSTRRLRLWNNNPLLHTAAALGPGYGLLLGQPATGLSHAEQLLGLHPNLMECADAEPQRVCVNFAGQAGTKLHPGIVWKHRGLRFKSLFGPASVQVQRRQRYPNLRAVLGWRWRWPSTIGQTCLVGQGRLSIRFPDPVSQVWIRFCKLPKISDNNPSYVLDTARVARTTKELTEIADEATAKGIAPDPSACRYPVVHKVSVKDDIWIIRTDEGFDCLAAFKTEDFAIAEICYLPAKERERAARAAAQCETNDGGGAESQSVLQPGSYYRLEIETRVAGALADFNDPLSFLYSPILEQLGFSNADMTYRHAAFFQTEGPPTNLVRYIKWSNPKQQATRVFRRDDFAIRFLRPNIKEMYGHKPHNLEMLIRSTTGHLIGGYGIAWNKAGSASLLHEEQLWREHRSDMGLANIAVEADDILKLSRVSAELEPNARYELLVSGGEGGRSLFQDDFTGLSGDTWKPNVIGWTAQAGVLTRQENSPAHITAGNSNWTDLELMVELKLTNNCAGGVLVRAVSTSKQEGNSVWNACRISLSRSRSGAFSLRMDALQRDLADGGSFVTKSLRSRPLNLDPGLWNRLRVSLVANRLRVWLFDNLLIEGTLYQVVRDWTTQNRPSGTLLFFNESLGAEHRPAFQRDDLLPSMQGQVGLYADGRGPEFRRMNVRDAVLQRVSFTTSAFGGFRELVKSGEAYGPVGITAATPATQAKQTALQAAGQLANTSWAWHRAQIDYRFEALDRKGLEEHKLALREARADHDAAFRSLAETVAQDLYYLSLAPHVALYLLRNDNGEVFGLWLRSPENLDLWQDVRDENDNLTDNHTGRTTISLTQRSVLEVEIFHDADSSQMLIFLESNAVWPSGFYQLTFAYHRNHGDEAGEGDHRYDRPVEMSGDMTNVETVPIAFTI